MEASRTAYKFDLQLARAISAGDVEAWHDFVQRYSSVIFSIARRYLADFDAEIWRDTYVDVLEYLYAVGLAKYDGRAALSTWVMAISRTRALDHRRALRGRKRDPVWLAALGPRDREVFHLYFEEGESIATIRERFAAQGVIVSTAEIGRSLARLDERMDRRLRTRLAYDLHARTVGMASGNLLDFIDHVRQENATAAEALRPDLILIERRTSQLLDRVQRAVRQLDPEERQIVELRFYRSLTAQQIADTLGHESPRRVYTLLDGAVRRLRRLALGSDAPAQGAAGDQPRGGNVD